MFSKPFGAAMVLPPTQPLPATSVQRPLISSPLMAVYLRLLMLQEAKSMTRSSKALEMWRLSPALPVWTVAIGLGILTLVVHGYRLSAAPDIFSDEGLYVLVGQNLALGHGLTGDNGPFLWHPPLYMLVEAAYIKGAGLALQGPVQLLFAMRWLNVLFSAFTAALLVLLGRQLHSIRAGSVMAALFVLDPYVQRINRRSMLETLAMLLTLTGLYIFIAYRQRRTRWRWFGSGIAFGLAALTKEAMLLQLLTLVGFAMWNRRADLGDAMRATAVALLTYASYVGWTFATGQGAYLSYQLFGLSRLVAPIIGHSFASAPPGTNLQTAPQAQSIENLQSLLPQYVMSYLLIVLAVASVIIMLTFWRRRLEVRYLICWSTVSFVGMGLAARVSDQFFYYVVVPATVVVGYACIAAFDSAVGTKNPSPRPRLARVLPLTAPANLGLILILLLGVTMAGYNGKVWFTEYATGSDDAYAQVFSYIQQNVPPGTTIVASDAVSKFFLPGYNIRFDRDTNVVIQRQEEYFIMSSKDRARRYEKMTPEFYDWVIGHSRPLFVKQGVSFGELGVYKRSPLT
jgi:4-amino-4-deoxy-L-arabinose transferase-like glycosyltransferase